ncbi:MAG: exodeoxyribonuclease V subunit gamma [Acidimicrobiales bacterium]
MLHLFVAETIDPLAQQLARRLAIPGPDPLGPELVAVPSGGMNRWIRLELAKSLGAAPGRTDGIAANIEVVFPGSIRARLLAADALAEHPPPLAAAPPSEPWAIERLVWSILQLIADPANARLLGAVASLPPGATWYGRARAIADLFRPLQRPSTSHVDLGIRATTSMPAANRSP